MPKGLGSCPQQHLRRHQCAFVNISRPGKPDEESRRLVKTYVMRHVLRSKPEVKTPKSLCLSLQFVKSSPQAPPSCFLTFPIQTEPYMLKLLHDYAGAMLPTESKVIDSAWFPLIMTDAALFHALLCTSALFGLHDMVVQRKHMLESIRLINDRLPGDGATSDATITAIFFLAKAEHFEGNHDAWSVHMDGVKTIVELRGGIGMLPRLIQQKIYSTDLLGCMEKAAPSLTSPRSINPTTYDVIHLLHVHQSHSPRPQRQTLSFDNILKRQQVRASRSCMYIPKIRRQHELRDPNYGLITYCFFFF